MQSNFTLICSYRVDWGTSLPRETVVNHGLKIIFARVPNAHYRLLMCKLPASNANLFSFYHKICVFLWLFVDTFHENFRDAATNLSVWRPVDAGQNTNEKQNKRGSGLW